MADRPTEGLGAKRVGTDRVGLFVPCLVDQFYPRSAIACVLLLEHFGFEVDFPLAQTCCGQPFYNTGYIQRAGRLAERMMTVFSEHSTVVTPSGSCASMARIHFAQCVNESQRDRAREFGPRVLELSEFLIHRAQIDFRALGARWSGSAAYHASCHLRDLEVTDEPTRLLSQVSGLTLHIPERSEQCCGFGGTFMAKYAGISAAMARDKIACLRASEPDALVISDAGCALNLEGIGRRNGWRPRVLSLGELLAESLGLLARPIGRT